MRDLLKWILYPAAWCVLRIGGDEGGGDTAGAQIEQDEARKAALRARIDKLYGIGGEKTPVYADQAGPEVDEVVPQYVDLGEGGSQLVMAPTGRKVPSSTRVIAGYQDDPEAAAAAASMDAENTKLADAVRGYHTDQLGKRYTDAERNTRFSLARKGLLGGSEDVFQQGEVKSDRDLGATRVDEAVRRAVSGLKTQREQERLNATQLVNAGAGDSAVSAAQIGLRNSFDNAESASKVNLFDDLFATGADALTANNASAQAALLGARYRDRLSSFAAPKSTTSGRNTPSY